MPPGHPRHGQASGPQQYPQDRSTRRASPTRTASTPRARSPRKTSIESRRRAIGPPRLRRRRRAGARRIPQPLPTRAACAAPRLPVQPQSPPTPPAWLPPRRRQRRRRGSSRSRRRLRVHRHRFGRPPPPSTRRPPPNNQTDGDGLSGVRTSGPHVTHGSRVPPPGPVRPAQPAARPTGPMARPPMLGSPAGRTAAPAPPQRPGRRVPGKPGAPCPAADCRRCHARVRSASNEVPNILKQLPQHAMDGSDRRDRGRRCRGGLQLRLVDARQGTTTRWSARSRLRRRWSSLGHYKPRHRSKSDDGGRHLPRRRSSRIRTIRPYLRMGEAQVSNDCRAAADGEVRKKLQTIGCSQVIRATFSTPDNKYFVTAGILNLARRGHGWPTRHRCQASSATSRADSPAISPTRSTTLCSAGPR